MEIGVITMRELLSDPTIGKKISPRQRLEEILAAIAQKTKRIRLTSAVTVLSTADPVREFENFATLDLFYREDGRR